jgi:hypothetical protein
LRGGGVEMQRTQGGGREGGISEESATV